MNPNDLGMNTSNLYRLGENLSVFFSEDFHCSNIYILKDAIRSRIREKLRVGTLWPWVVYTGKMMYKDVYIVLGMTWAALLRISLLPSDIPVSFLNVSESLYAPSSSSHFVYKIGDLIFFIVIITNTPLSCGR